MSGKKPKAKASHTILDTDKVFPLIVRLSLPMMLGTLVQSLYNTVDTIFITRFVGSEAAAGLTISNILQFLLIGLGAMISVGSGALISHSLGKRNYRLVFELLKGSLVTTLIVAGSASIILSLGLPFIVNLLGNNQPFLSHTIEYSSITMRFGFVIVFQEVCGAILRARGHARISMALIIIPALINIALDALFILVFGWGVAGAAWATIISLSISLSLALMFIYRFYGVRRVPFLKIPYKWTMGKDILVTGSASGLRIYMTTLVLVVINRAVQGYGVPALAAYGSATRLMQMAFMAAFGIMLGSAPVIAFNYGAGRYKRIVHAFTSAVSLQVGAVLSVSLVFMIFPEFFLSLFTNDPEVLAIGRSALRLIILPTFLFGFQIMSSAFLQSTNRPRLAILYGIVRPITQIFILMWLPGLIGLTGVWLSYMITDIINSCVAFFIVRNQFARLKHLFPSKQPT